MRVCAVLYGLKLGAKKWTFFPNEADGEMIYPLVMTKIAIENGHL